MNERLYKDLQSRVEYILYYSNATRWGVLSVTNPLKDDPYFKDDTLILTGNFDGVYQGCDVTFDGEYKVHPKYGAQIAISRLVVSADTLNKESVINFLSKSHIKGIDTQNAKKIWEKFGKDSVKVVLNDPQRLTEIKGIGDMTLAKVMDSVTQYKRMEELINFCNDLGIPYSVTYKLDQALGDDALATIKNNVYQVLDISDTLSFTQIDAIAIKMGMSPTDSRRTKACLKYCIHNRIVMNSSTGCVNAELKDDFYKKLGIVDVALYNCTLRVMVENGELVMEGSNIFLKPYYEKERFIAYAISNLLRTPLDNYNITQERIDEAMNSFPFELNRQQKEAIQGIVNSRVSVLTGGPGSGKSTITKAIVEIFTKSGVPVFCLSPTGKATRRMEECTGFPAQTIHKFLNCKGEPLDLLEPPVVAKDTAIIIDESSMLDISMLNKLLEITNVTPIRLILVGDKDQLPSVLAGNILSDLLHSNFKSVFRLTDIMRQAKDSHIIRYCADVNNGTSVKPCRYDDFIFTEYYDSNDLYNDLMSAYTKEVKENGLMEVQVITAYKKGTLGTINLNKDIAEWYNPSPINEQFGYRVGDKIMQISNDYKKDVFNGEVGICTSMSHDEMNVEYQSGNDISYYTEELSSLMLAYASTCHKSQGAEYKVVFVVLDDTNGNFLLTRKLLYTAMSRGKKRVYILAKSGCLKNCVDNVFETPRITKLCDFLKDHHFTAPSVMDDIEEIPF